MGGGGESGGGSFSGAGSDACFGNFPCEQCAWDVDRDFGIFVGWRELALCVFGGCCAGVSDGVGDGGGEGAGSLEEGRGTSIADSKAG